MEKEDPVGHFYDELSGLYHMIISNWQDFSKWNGQVIHNLLKEHYLDWIMNINKNGDQITVLDCTCGIGTQCLALASIKDENGQHIFRMLASDLSEKSIERAKLESDKNNITIDLRVGDVRKLQEVWKGHQHKIDLIISCDNSLAHLIEPDDLKTAVTEMYQLLKPGGMVFITLRDYDQIKKEKPLGIIPKTYNDPDGKGKRIIFQTWEWFRDDTAYKMKAFIMTKESDDKDWKVKELDTVLRAVQRDEVSKLLEDIGFKNIKWFFPSSEQEKLWGGKTWTATDYYQPIVVAIK